MILHVSLHSVSFITFFYLFLVTLSLFSSVLLYCSFVLFSVYWASSLFFFFFFFNDPATPEFYPLSLHDALPISCVIAHNPFAPAQPPLPAPPAMMSRCLAPTVSRQAHCGGHASGAR